MTKLKILIAEDDKVIQALYSKGLPGQICEMRMVANGEEALAVYKEWKPDILLLDHGMPILNGYQTLKSIRTAANDKTITIIMVTALSDKEEVVACAKLGIQGYIVKPFKTNEIAGKIMHLYKAHKG